MLLFIFRFFSQVKIFLKKPFVQIFYFQALLKLQYAISGMPNMFGCSEILPVGSQNQTSDSSTFEDDISQRILVMSSWEEGISVRENAISMVIQEQTISVLENKCERLYCKICLWLAMTLWIHMDPIWPPYGPLWPPYGTALWVYSCTHRSLPASWAVNNWCCKINLNF